MDQAFETKKANWQRDDIIEEFRSFCDHVFTSETIKISRADLFEHCAAGSPYAFYFIVFWGYPRNMRGNSFASILGAIKELSSGIQYQQSISVTELKELIRAFDGVGLSTLSKFLYFFRVQVGGLPSMILDSRIIEVLQNGLYEELLSLRKKSTYNQSAYYIEYLAEITKISQAEGYKPDQLELFLFQYGNNLKSTVASRCYSGEL
jgi:hypothetical protein